MSDFYDIEALLPDPDRVLPDEVRSFMREDVPAPIINDHWSREEFPPPGVAYEGTRKMNSLIVGIGITGQSAFVGK